LKPGTTLLYLSRTAGATEQIYDWYDQDKEGIILYFGEDSKEYNNGKVNSTGGSWEAGKDGAKPGIIVTASSKAGETYRQGYYKGEAEDMAKAPKLDQPRCRKDPSITCS
jgi:hypothetical protein